MKTNLNERSRFQLIKTEKTTEKPLLNSSNRATIVCTNEELHKLAAQIKQEKKCSTRFPPSRLYLLLKIVADYEEAFI